MRSLLAAAALSLGLLAAGAASATAFAAGRPAGITNDQAAITLAHYDHRGGHRHAAFRPQPQHHRPHYAPAPRHHRHAYAPPWYGHSRHERGYQYGWR